MVCNAAKLVTALQLEKTTKIRIRDTSEGAIITDHLIPFP
jgi:hypothetical protein